MKARGQAAVLEKTDDGFACGPFAARKSPSEALLRTDGGGVSRARTYDLHDVNVTL